DDYLLSKLTKPCPPSMVRSAHGSASILKDRRHGLHEWLCFYRWLESLLFHLLSLPLDIFCGFLVDTREILENQRRCAVRILLGNSPNRTVRFCQTSRHLKVYENG